MTDNSEQYIELQYDLKDAHRRIDFMEEKMEQLQETLADAAKSLGADVHELKGTFVKIEHLIKYGTIGAGAVLLLTNDKSLALFELLIRSLI